jgi:hypothetical protein
MIVHRVAAVGIAALLGAGALAGCSSSATPAASTPAASAPAASAPAAASSAASSTAASAASSAGTQMLPPVIVTEGQTTANAKVGDFIDIVVKKVAGTTIDTDKPDLLEISQAREEGGAVFNPGAKALAPGTAIITVTNPDNSTRDITVTITAS